MAIELSEKQIKDGWQIVKFGEIAKEVKSTTKDPAEVGLEFYVGLEHLDPQSLRIARKGIIAEDNPSFTRRFSAGQILFGKRRCYQKKAAVADFDGICSGDIIVMDAIPKKIIPGLLPFIIQSDTFFDWAEKTSSGSLSPRTKWKSLAEFEFPLPPVKRQKEILEVLEKVEDSLFHADTSIKSLDLLTKKVLSKLAPNSSFCKLGDICEIVSGQHIAASDYDDRGSGTSYLTGPDDFPNGKIIVTKYTYKPKAMCKKGDVLLTVKGSGVGKSVVADSDYCISRQLMAIRGTKVSTEYVSLAIRLLCDDLNKISCGVIPGVSKKQVSDFKISEPEKEDTLSLVIAISEMDILRDHLSKKTKSLSNLKKSITQTSLFHNGGVQ